MYHINIRCYKYDVALITTFYTNFTGNPKLFLNKSSFKKINIRSKSSHASRKLGYPEISSEFCVIKLLSYII
jgi:hypothetical protein